MAPKRLRDTDEPGDSVNTDTQAPKKQRKGFTVGPENLPDGTYRRKAQKIKNDLIQKAKVKKAYAKIKAAEAESVPARSSYYNYDDETRAEEDDQDAAEKSPGLELHPDRLAMISAEGNGSSNGEKWDNRHQGERGRRRERRPKPSAFTKELEIAEKRRQEKEAREKERNLKAKEREEMVRAKKPDQFGKRRLGRESKVLLSKVQRLVGQS
ncbi:hypothetical protein BGW36DRAFT_376051 [Talaromyces proteolyticus]|uniref:rRNA-processing protein FYV7 n=1 Tax=Talaromyces proteolyticus TaxID=1131652 RepID=A0AAD4KU15_9EURO|nr:uncharacterized protein BGW36DRAFT_376051 [Talaromyces proteolyticus]KAH8698424.1 hypothetical protein BGW36DRAFT_376051 [Talaromyces proteolyticus]